jgi:hypothetical protein
MFQTIQLALRDYQRARIRRALKLFRRSAITLLCSRLGRMALQSAQEMNGADLTPEERRHLARAQLLTTLGKSEIEAEDWIVKALVELALCEIESPSRPSAMECFYP